MIEDKEFLVMVCFGMFSNNRLKCLCASHLSQSCSKPPGVSSCSSIILLDFSILCIFIFYVVDFFSMLPLLQIWNMQFQSQVSLVYQFDTYSTVQ